MPSSRLSRRHFLAAASATAALTALPKSPAQSTTSPSSPRQRLSLNLDWRFLRDDVPSAESPAFDDAKWQTISLPHSFNDIDSFRTIISHGGGDRGMYKGLAWYRKHLKTPTLPSNGRAFLEFEGMRQAGDIFLNGKPVGLYENGVTAYGIDITAALNPAGQDNVLAVKVDNRTTYAERATSTTFQWNSNDFNPDHGGITRHVWLHVTGPVHQTLPLYYGLESQGIYIHAANFDIAKKTADITVESEVQNGLPNTGQDRATVGLSVVILDSTNQLRARFEADPVDMVAGEKTVIMATGTLKDARLWSPADPYLYIVVTTLTIDGKPVDTVQTITGFRKAQFKGGTGTGGVYLNDQFLYLKGFAQRSSNEWAGLGGAYPDWLHDYTAKMIRDSHANYLRWMHVAPARIDADALTRAGIVQVCPAGDKEGDPNPQNDPTGRRWQQRLEVMRATIIYFRNNPGILFWEAGNTVISVEHMQQMLALRKQWDPEGGRVMGARGDGNNEKNAALTPIAEYYGVMIGQAPQTDALTGPTDIFRAYSAERRDRAPIIETEDFRDEGARRYWDNDSPPYFGFKKGPSDTYEYTSETFALAGVRRYWDYWSNRISKPDPAHSKWSGYASIYFSDSNADGRQDSSEVARVSGKVDAVRLPKQIYFAHRIIQNESHDIHILGHWSYPLDRHVTKTIYVISNCPSVELFLNGKSLGTNTAPESGYIFAFPSVAFAPGTLKAVGTAPAHRPTDHTLTTAGPATQIRLTPILSPTGWRADGQDAALLDVEVLDAKGQRVPTDDARIDFAVTGPALWRGGYNSGKTDSTNDLWLNTELGINRVALRSTLTPGLITVTAKREGLKPANAQLITKTKL